MNQWILKILTIPTLLFTTGLYAAVEDEIAPADQGMWQTIIMIGIAVVFFYFILWRPEQKRRNALDEQRNEMKKGDRVTAMGIIGTIDRVQDQTVILKMYDGAKIEVLKGAITEVEHSAAEEISK